MRIKEGYILRSVAGSYMVVPVGSDNIHLNKVISLNETGAILWKKLEDNCEIDLLADELCMEYGIDKSEALRDTNSFVEKLKENGFLTED